MVSGTERKYYMLGGKGGVGKTSCAASLAVKFANNGHHTLVVSTDPAHSLSDSFAQDLTGGMLVPVEGPDFPLFALEVRRINFLIKCPLIFFRTFFCICCTRSLSYEFYS
ncbi:hypothetical protein Goarm_009796 [Gossypium armourianum]|uniref:ArsA/GET3 Anion-transporting ATPase-like domain-containing protein n=1 Tax=Gossypium armourianum TaxID=34283 RepID=A0A7J9JU54_9ROSI|nr:hypothetical protein [Gossypium armourianum]